MGEQVIVVGLGRFGAAAARTLHALGHEILAVDAAEEVVNEIAPDVTHAVQADASDENALRALGAANFDTAVVAMSSNVEASIFATLALKRLGVRTVIAKAANEIHGEILERVGANRVVYAEREAGEAVAHTIRIPAAVEYLDLAPSHGIAKLRVPDWCVGRSLQEVDLAGRFRLSTLALVRANSVLVNPSRVEVLRSDDELVLLGNDDQIARVTAARH
jgi:trk system potassium uptake protein TrkA